MPIKIVKEETVESYYLKAIAEAFPGSETVKYEVRRGEPDRLTLLPGGKAIFVELKRPNKHPRPEQERALERKRKLGFDAHYANTKEKVDALIAYLLERQARGWI